MTIHNSALKWLPKWRNPKVNLLDMYFDEYKNLDVITESENFETFSSDKKHPISMLCRNATSLDASCIPSSAISFLPKTIIDLQFDISEREPLSLESASNAFKGLDSNSEKINTQYYNSKLPYTVFGWPPGLTTLTLYIHIPQPLDLGCLPSTITECVLSLYEYGELSLDGDLSHMTKLSNLHLISSPSVIATSKLVFPRSLRTLFTSSWKVQNPLFKEPEMQNFFFNLEILDLGRSSYDADIMLYLPRTLKELKIVTTRDGAALCEKHFEGIFQTKLADLKLKGHAIWPKALGFDVFSRFLPPTLVKLCLKLGDIVDTGKEQEIAKHIPVTLSSFRSSDISLQALVEDRIHQYRISRIVI